MLQPLESRRMFSANFVGVSVVFDPSAGSLTVVGTHWPDAINVRIEETGSAACLDRIDGQRPILPEVGTLLTVYDNEELIYHNEFYGQELQFVQVFALGGDDSIGLVNYNRDIPTFVVGDEGDDRIYSLAYGIAPGSHLWAGSGNDFVSCVALNTRLSGAGFVVFGEEGDDMICGSVRDDVLYGDFDDIRENVTLDGHDSIYAGAGHDALFGGAGNDMLFGQAGDDFLVGGAGADRLDGGEGTDLAIFDREDKLILDIENLVQQH